MKPYPLISISFCLIFLFSCNNQTVNENRKKSETPKALQEGDMKIVSYVRSSGNLIEELYAELVDKTPSLKKLEDDLNGIAEKTKDLREKFDKYDSKSNSYYNLSEYKVTAIEDSLLRKKMYEILATSKNQYDNRKSELSFLINQLNENVISINDHHTVLKIVLTLPLIEQYQKDNLPDKKEFKDLINEQQKLIQLIDSLTPKY